MFDFTKKIDLSYLGEGWKDCYISFKPFSIAEIKELPQLAKGADDPSQATKNVDTILDLLKGKFVEGFGVKNGERTAFKKEDIDEFPAELVMDIMSELNGGLDKKKLNQSQTP